MRQAFAHEAVVVLEPGADVRAPGAAVTAALCGHWVHEPPCPLAPHRVDAEQVDAALHVRVLFAAEPEQEAVVRQLIELALSGRFAFPDGLTATWQLRECRRSDVLRGEADLARKLIRHRE